MDGNRRAPRFPLLSLRTPVPRLALVAGLLGLAGNALSQSEWTDDRSCAACHRTHADGHVASAHALTSAWPTAASVKGNFSPGANRLTTSNPHVSFLMAHEAEAFFQIARVVTPVHTLQRKERIGFVMGSGRKAQTYLYWDKDLLMELPVSYWMKTGEWMNSPGYIDGTANFERGVSTRCLECHTASYENIPPERHRFRPDSITPGISCQKCHGPAGRHVRLAQSGKLAAGAPAEIVNPAKLSRERQLDLCALCHAGAGQSLTPPLSYRVGDVLAQHLAIKAPLPEQPADPHGSQVQGLLASRCFQASATLTCTTCHDVHQQQRRPETFAQSCRQCHQPQACGQFATRQDSIANQCVDCHMPLAATAKVILRRQGQRFQPEVRDHRIGIHGSEGR